MVPSISQSSAGMHTNSVPNADGSSNVYVHHISHGATAASAPPPPQPQMPQMMGIPYPMPMPMQAPPAPIYVPYPSYPPPPPSYGCPYNHHHQQHQQPSIVIINQDEPKPPPKSDKKKEEEKKKKEEEEKKKKAKGPQKTSKFTIVSVIVFSMALILSIACIVTTFAAEDSRIEAEDAGDEDLSDNEQYSMDRSVALMLGCAAGLCFTIATLCSFYAGMRHKSKGDAKKEHCCLSGFVIAAWIVFCMTSITNLIVLVLAFDAENIIYPEVVLVGFVGNMLSCMLMFGYSELARKM
eukprot:CAMPEP_0181125148 /NCGR_PEP_ID=MMETSP1071-20121207/26880_1 /TAXON_ID=35127 /ORGANISM="Thalassiosira sp., Strain NH16" /LENGTH=294 /DNA_ID=CAMNT_0023210541 /DNA_START=250 /DNA_END=1134 /DNA_ORIENTATION=+